MQESAEWLKLITRLSKFGIVSMLVVILAWGIQMYAFVNYEGEVAQKIRVTVQCVMCTTQHTMSVIMRFFITRLIANNGGDMLSRFQHWLAIISSAGTIKQFGELNLAPVEIVALGMARFKGVKWSVLPADCFVPTEITTKGTLSSAEQSSAIHEGLPGKEPLAEVCAVDGVDFFVRCVYITPLFSCSLLTHIYDLIQPFLA
jgi:hypothetical protein